MKMGLLIIATALLLFGSYGSSFGIGFGDLQDLNILTPTDLANALVGPGNVVPGSVLYLGANIAAGTFTNGLVDGIGINQGVLLTNGDVFNAVGPNIDPAAGIDNFLMGTGDLDALIAPRISLDATVLEFDFIPPPYNVTLTFDVVFASDEYPDSVGTDFDDVFALFVNGANIALVPGTTDPISINTLNAAATPLLFNDNFTLPVPPFGPFGTQYNGFSKVLRFTVKVTPGLSHHIKLAIADGSSEAVPDAIVDSAAFLSTTLGDILGQVTRYYNTILGRAPEPGGAESWSSQIERIFNLGIDIGEGFQSVGMNFFNGPEYLGKGKSDTDYITDLYQAFLNRAPDPAGLNNWLNQLAQGLTREVLIVGFANSAEFRLFMENHFGSLPTRPENNLVNDFYRGILARLPDSVGFNGWLGQMRIAQCTGAQAVRDKSHEIALIFIESPEYAARGRTDAEYVGDLYNAILRRTPDAAGFNGWVTALSTQTREQVLGSFVHSPEFQLRVQEVIDAGCLP